MVEAPPTAELTWNVREGFRAYVAAIDDGEQVLGEGAVARPDPAGPLVFPVADLSGFDASSGRGEVRCGGRAEFRGHRGLLQVLLRDLRITVTEEGGVLSVLDPDDPSASAGRCDLLLFPRAGPESLPGGLRLTWAPARLTFDGARAFGHAYPVGAEFDPLSLTLPVPDRSRSPRNPT